jgi:hypothetical protein
MNERESLKHCEGDPTYCRWKLCTVPRYCKVLIVIAYLIASARTLYI